MRQHRQELIALEEPHAGVVFLQERNVWFLNQLPRLDGEVGHPLECGEFSIDSAFETPVMRAPFELFLAL
jgi:hypothetical protein